MDTAGQPVDQALRTVYLAARGGETSCPVPWAGEA